MTWDKTKPDGALPVSVGDDGIRLNNDHLENFASKEHEFPGTYGTTNGRHKFPLTATAAAMGALVGPVDGMLTGRTDLPILYQRQSAAFVAMKGYVYDTNANRVAFPTANIPPGLIWVESDTEYAYIYDAGWKVLSYYTVTPPAPARTDSTFERSLTANDAWEPVEVSAGVDMEVSQTVPAEGDWIYNVRGRVALSKTTGTPKIATRLKQDYDTGTLTYPDDAAVAANNDNISNVPLSCFVDATGENGKPYIWGIEYSCDTNNANVYVNRPESGSGHGPGSLVPPKSFIEVCAIRVG